MRGRRRPGAAGRLARSSRVLESAASVGVGIVVRRRTCSWPRRRDVPGRSACSRGRPGRSTAIGRRFRPITSAKIEGTTSKVANVDITRPPITARPSGACIWLPRSSASAIGTMPTVIAQAVIRIGRSRSLAPTMAASVEDAPAFQWSLMNVTSMTEFDTETPRHMIEPMNDSMLSEVLVT